MSTILKNEGIGWHGYYSKKGIGCHTSCHRGPKSQIVIITVFTVHVLWAERINSNWINTKQDFCNLFMIRFEFKPTGCCYPCIQKSKIVHIDRLQSCRNIFDSFHCMVLLPWPSHKLIFHLFHLFCKKTIFFHNKYLEQLEFYLTLIPKRHNAIGFKKDVVFSRP